MTAEEIEGATGSAPVPSALRARRMAGLVLPRILRRPVRMLRNAGWRSPRYLGTKSVAVLFAMTIAGGVVIGGHAKDVAAAATVWAGLGIDQVKITGQSRTEELDILHRLDTGPFPSLLTFDIDAAKSRIETLPWVAEATLRKLYPHNLEVVVRERQPYAVWQNDGKLWLIDEQGHPIAEVSDDRYASLPVVVGDGAAARASEFTGLIANTPSLARHVRAGVLVGGRRWTIVMDGGVELMLPEDKASAALATVAKLDADSALLSRAISVVDLRVPGEVVVRLDADGAAARSALLKVRSKIAKAKT